MHVNHQVQMVVFTKYYFNSRFQNLKDDTKVGMGSDQNKHAPLKHLHTLMYYTH